MGDINCAHCNEPWEVYFLLHENLMEPAELRASGGVPKEIINAAEAHEENVDKILDEMPPGLSISAIEGRGYRSAVANEEQGAKVRKWIHTAVLSGKGCPYCGFQHKGEGDHRIEQLKAMTYDSSTFDGDLIDYI